MATRNAAMDMQCEVPEYYRPLSLMLYQVMEDIGASTEMRNLWRERSAVMEITLSIGSQKCWYCFGSRAEGTTTEDMDPDEDLVLLDKSLSVLTDCSNYHSGFCSLLVQDENTEAGYVKLQLLCRGVPLYVTDQFWHTINLSTELFNRWSLDKDNRVVLTNFRQFSPGVERHGPAIFFIDDYCSSDFVRALHCADWPVCASEWLTRQRLHTWPYSSDIEKCKALGCLLVPVGHPHSEEMDKQWRISFSHQERLLVRQFTSVQLKCYILLKLVKQKILQNLILQDSLSSYHCKTCMLYMIENTPSNFWRPDNLLGCFISCLKLLRVWCNLGICPNYFIPAENMFDRLTDETKLRLNLALRTLLSSDCKYLLQIETSGISRRLKNMLTRPAAIPVNRPEQDVELQVNKCPLLSDIVYGINVSKRLLLKWCAFDTIEICLSYMNKKKQWYKHVYSTINYDIHERRQAAYILFYIELNFVTNLIALGKQQGRSREDIWQYLSSDIWHRLSQTSESSAKLKQASLMYMFEYYDASLDVLSSLLSEFNNKFSVCMCYEDAQKCVLPFNEIFATFKGEISTKMIVHSTVSCVEFLPTERDVTPEAICYEMLRFIDVPSTYSVAFCCDYQREVAQVDGIFLLHFLQYLNHNKLNMSSHVQADIDNMNWYINSTNLFNRFRCSHRDACLNILGWVYKDQGHVDRAVECFRRSREIEPVANAATWHLWDTENTRN